MECAHTTVRGFNAHYNNRDTLTNPELLLEGLYAITVNVLVFVLVSAPEEKLSAQKPNSGVFCFSFPRFALPLAAQVIRCRGGPGRRWPR